jgi:hypothetical protein
MELRLWVFYSGYNRDLDDKIEKIVGVDIDGSGYNLIDDERDISFPFDKKKKGKTPKQQIADVVAKLKKAKIPGFRYGVYEDES